MVNFFEALKAKIESVPNSDVVALAPDVLSELLSTLSEARTIVDADQNFNDWEFCLDTLFHAICYYQMDEKSSQHNIFVKYLQQTILNCENAQVLQRATDYLEELN